MHALTGLAGLSAITNQKRVLAPSFAITDLPNLKAWYRFGDLTTLWQDTGGTSPVTADGQSIARADDKSGNGYHLTQGTAGQQPVYKASIQNGQGVARFDGSNDLLANTSFFDLSTESMYFFAVVKYVNGGLPGQAAIFGVHDGTFAHGSYLSNISPDFYSRYWGDGNGDGFGGIYQRVGADVRNGNTYIWSGYLDGGTINLMRNGSAYGTQSVNYVGPNPYTWSQLVVGCLDTGQTFPINGDIMELILGSAGMTPTLRASTESLLNTLYAVY